MILQPITTKRCLLRKPDGAEQVAWIHEDLAVAGRRVDIVGEEGLDRGWMVVEVYEDHRKPTRAA